MTNEQMRLELSKLSISQAEHDLDTRHKAIQETHWIWQRWVWVGTVVLLALGIIFK